MGKTGSYGSTMPKGLRVVARGSSTGRSTVAVGGYYAAAVMAPTRYLQFLGYNINFLSTLA